MQEQNSGVQENASGLQMAKGIIENVGEAIKQTGMGGGVQGTQTKANQTKLMVLIGSIATIIGCFMPFYTVSVFGYSESVSYTEGDGIFAIILAIGAIVLAVLNLQKFSLIPAAITLLMVIVELINANDVASGFGSVGIGAYVVIIGAIVTIVGGVLAFMWKIKR